MISRLALAALLVMSCSGGAARPIFVGSTTTTQDTGILDALTADFKARTGREVKLVVAGSGQILETARRGELDVILTHSPADEERFVRDGFGTGRRLVMHNDFVLLGPTADPVGIAGRSAAEAMRAIAAAAATFISRGDRSGTHVRELELWRAAGIEPRGTWYVESSAGQLQTLQLASQRRAYVLADRGTWRANRSVLDLRLLVEGGREMLNIYHVTLVDPAKATRVNAEGGRAFADHLVSSDGQRLIAEFGKDRFGQALFIADAGKREEDLR